MKPSQFAKRAIKRLEQLEAEKINKIHEIWKIESDIRQIKDSLDACGFQSLETFINYKEKEL